MTFPNVWQAKIKGQMKELVKIRPSNKQVRAL